MHKRDYIGIILNLFDGDGAGAATGTGGSEGDGSPTSAGVRPDVRARGREIGVSDDLMESYQKAFHADKAQAEGETRQTDDNDNGEADQEDTDAAFEELIKGKFKDAYHKRVEGQIKDRFGKLGRERAELENRAARSDKVLHLLAEKYGSDDPEAIYNALRGDRELWRQQAIDKGQTAEEFIEDYDQRQNAAAQQEELENLRRYRQANELHERLRGLARETAKQYPGFDFDAEFANAKFRAALDFVAAQNEEKNRAAGTAGEVFDVTFAYELAHADELRANQIKRVSKATASAVAQTLQANRERPRENALRTGAPSKVSAYQTMSDKEFDDYLEKVRRHEAKI